MPRVDVPHQQISRSGTIISGTGVSEVVADPTNDHSVVNDGRVLIAVRNTDAAPQSVVFVTPGTVDTQAVADRSESITDGVQEIFGPFSPAEYGDVLNIDVTNANLRLMALYL